MLLERGDVANSWRHERWDSLRLLTPNWQTRLPGFHYDGPDPDGYMTMGEVVEFIDRFAAFSRAPVRTHTEVTAVAATATAITSPPQTASFAAGRSSSRAARATVPHVPALHDAIPPSIPHVTPFDYRNPSQLPEGRVLVVGPSATGVQLAAEIHRSGRP